MIEHLFDHDDFYIKKKSWEIDSQTYFLFWFLGGKIPKSLRPFFFASILARTWCSISSSEMAPPREYHVTVSIPRTAVNTHL